jgi:gluconokinase
VVVDKPTVDGEGSLWCYCLSSDRWTYGGIVTNVGNACQWLGNNIASFGRDERPEAAFARLDAYASAVAPGSEGVFFLPYLRKVRSPYWDDRLTGTVYGLGPDHDVRHLARAMLEAIAYDIAAITDRMGARVPLKSSFVLTGGLSKNALMARLLADVLNREILVPECNEGSVAGAAVIALRGLGMVDDLSFDRRSERRYEAFAPDRGRSAVYRDLQADYVELVTRFRELGATLRGGTISGKGERR